MGELRDLRGPRGDRRDVGPVPLPPDPVRLRHVHARLLVPAVGRREGARRSECATWHPKAGPEDQIAAEKGAGEMGWGAGGGPVARGLAEPAAQGNMPQLSPAYFPTLRATDRDAYGPRRGLPRRSSGPA